MKIRSFAVACLAVVALTIPAAGASALPGPALLNLASLNTPNVPVSLPNVANTVLSQCPAVTPNPNPPSGVVNRCAVPPTGGVSAVCERNVSSPVFLFNSNVSTCTLTTSDVTIACTFAVNSAAHVLTFSRGCATSGATSVNAGCTSEQDTLQGVWTKALCSLVLNGSTISYGEQRTTPSSVTSTLKIGTVTLTCVDNNLCTQS